MASVTYNTDIWEDDEHALYVWKRKREWEDYPMYVASYSIPGDMVARVSTYTLNDLKDLILDKKLEFSVDTEMWLRARDNEIS